MALFWIKKEAQGVPPATSLGALSERVSSLLQQGLTNDQIVEALQRENYPSDQIVEALTRATRESIEPFAPPQEPSPLPPPPMPEQFSNPLQQPQPQSQMYNDYPNGQMASFRSQEDIASTVEELVDSIVEEKWAELSKDFAKNTEWQETVNAKIAKLEQSVADLRSDVENLHNAVIGKVGEYDKNLLNVNSQMKAMDKVFQQVLPQLSDSVSELSRLAKKGRDEE